MTQALESEKHSTKLDLPSRVPISFTRFTTSVGIARGSAHAKLVTMGLNETHFNGVLEHLASTLQELGVSDELIREAAAIAASTRQDVLGK